MSDAVEGTAIAHYVGTEIGGRWWKRYRAPGFFAGGRGRFWFEDSELRCHRDLTKELTRIPLARIRDISIGTWHAGKPIVKVGWERDGESLSSGFSFADRAKEDAFVAGIRGRLGSTD